MSIPVARERLKAIAQELPEPHRQAILDVIEEETYRAKPIAKSQRDSAKFTDELRQQICDFYWAHSLPRPSFKKMSSIFNVSVGRISEALNNVYPNRKVA